MPRWICSIPNCTTWVYAPAVRPVHLVAANPNFQTKDPHCPVHYLDLTWTPDPVVAVAQGPIAVAAQNMGERHNMNGILVAQYNGNVPIYCDYHQRKHVFGGNWPGAVHVDKPLFLDGIYDQGNLGLCSLLATTVPWANFRNVLGGVDIIFNCGQSVVGTEGETDILLQGGFQNGGATITFHAYPVSDDGPRRNTYNSCRANGRMIQLDVARFL